MRNPSKDSYYDGLNSFSSKANELQKNSAIASTMQMLAHDVRKPFFLLRLALNSLSKANNPSQIQFILKNITPEIDRAINKVNGMLTDVMEISSTSQCLRLEPISPEYLLELSIADCLRNYQKSNINFYYNFHHEHMIMVDPIKIDRVFSNILSNAIEAMNFEGNIWFHTKEVLIENIYFIEFCIGNDNSYLYKDELDNIFKEFYTRNKVGGTGLGLTIAEKMIKAHGGEIWCKSIKDERYPKGKVEFWFTIPIAENNLKNTTQQLPHHSSKIAKINPLFAN